MGVLLGAPLDISQESRAAVLLNGGAGKPKSPVSLFGAHWCKGVLASRALGAVGLGRGKAWEAPRTLDLRAMFLYGEAR